MEDLVSIIMPTYNRGYIIQRAIDSVLAQTYENWELIIVDDGSVDDTEDVVKRIEDERIRYLGYTPNKGANHARNVGLSEAKGRFISFLDSDTVYAADFLELSMQEFEDKHADVVWGKLNFILEEKDLVNCHPAELEKDLNDPETFLRLQMIKGMINTNAVCMKRRCVEEIGGFDEQMKRFQEREFFIRIALAQKYKIVFMDNLCADAYIMPDSISSHPELLWPMMFYILKKHLVSYRKHGVLAEYLQGMVQMEGESSEVVNEIAGILDENEKKELFSMLTKRVEELRVLHINLCVAYENMHETLTEKIKKMDWRLPLDKIPAGTRLVIYGAGEIGTSFVRQIAANHFCNVVLWVDKNHERMGKAVCAPENILDCNYDYVLVSIMKDEIVKEVEEFLVALGVDRTRILTL